MSSRKLSDILRKSREKSQKKMMSFMADQIARVVPKIVSELQGSNTPPSSVDSKAEKQKPTKFSYKHFISCNHKPFTGSDGVTAMLEWFDSIEVTFINSECPDHLKTRSATGIFQGRTLEWWSNERNIRSNEEAFALPWNEDGDDNLAYTTRFKQLSLIVPHLVSTPKRMITKYINGLPPAMRDSIEAAQLDTIEEVYRLGVSLNHNHVPDKQFATPATSKSANQVTQQPSGSKNKKRKSQGSGCNAITPATNPAAKPAPATTTTNPATLEAKKQYTGSYPKCTTCNFHHPTASACRLCTNCNRYGHTTPYCHQANKAQQALQAPAQAALPAPPAPLQNPKPVNVVRACFQCGDTTHLRNCCPQLNQEQQAAARGRAFNLNSSQARNNKDVVNDMFLVDNLYASILFDTGADKSIVSVDFESLINCTRSKLPKSFSVEVSNGKSILVNSIIRDCSLTHNSHVFSIDLIPMRLGSFDVIIGMDWLRKNHAKIVCHNKLVRLPLPSGDILNVYGDRPSRGLRLMSCTQANKSLRKQSPAFLAHMVEPKSKGKNINDVPVVCDFPDVFPEDLPGLPPPRSVDFRTWCDSCRQGSLSSCTFRDAGIV
ncbi:putative transcription factor interactor and regulator CCHC(Zn) family [Helianthus annuus]|nr:putative transcription factor interactor and regulator CCHC(Zn) family [Helianthus annuus]KAJ0447143.1 putative transcription factor interactor and regulator CCHC(Zn) family [Helianthus annuus]KAJ0632051.1 putative transcription factor interactor and regulator CCHC(Zn) family [Helianthus annuus]